MYVFPIFAVPYRWYFPTDNKYFVDVPIHKPSNNQSFNMTLTWELTWEFIHSTCIIFQDLLDLINRQYANNVIVALFIS